MILAKRETENDDAAGRLTSVYGEDYSFSDAYVTFGYYRDIQVESITDETNNQTVATSTYDYNTAGQFQRVRTCAGLHL